MLYLSLVEINVSSMPKVFLADKIVHFSFHFVLSAFACLMLFFEHNYQKSIKTVSFVFFFSLIFGIIIECFQEVFTTKRHADIFDVLANVVGSLTMLIIMYYWVILKNQFKE